MRTMLLAIAIIASPAVAMDLSEIRDLTVREYQDLDMFTRAAIMEPVAKEAGVSYDKVNACLNGSARHPVLRRELIEQAVAGCIEWAKGR